jgi:homoserine dehydrogenase
MPALALAAAPAAAPESRRGRYYLRLEVADRPGVLADLTAALRDAGVSIESLIQPAPAAPEATALIVMVTHDSAESDVRRALAAMAQLPATVGAPLYMPILPLEG